jgi:N-carbamoylputrescine amidase
LLDNKNKKDVFVLYCSRLFVPLQRNLETLMKIGFLQQHNVADTKQNLLRLAEGISDLAKRGAELIVLQELHNSLYFCQVEDVNNFDLAEPIPGPSTAFFGELAKQLGVVIVTSLFERRAPGLYHNTAVVLEKDGSIAGKYRKMHIPDDPGYYEKFYFTPGDLGFKPIQTSVGRLGVLVCWDQWYPEAARLMALQGAELLIYPTAIGYDPNDTPEEQERQRMAWQTVQRGHAVANGLHVITVNRVGNEECAVANSTLSTLRSALPLCPAKNSQLFWGTSFVAGPQGELLYEASKDEEESIIVEIDLGRSEQVRRWWPFLRDRRIDEYGEITKRYIDNKK